MGTKARVTELPKCDFCKEDHREKDAHYDGKTKSGPWAFMCDGHFALYGTGLGTGIGQQLILIEKENDIETD